MKRIFLILMIAVALAVSGCTEKGPSGNAPSVGDLEAKVLSAANNLSTYSLTSSVNETLKLKANGKNATSEMFLTISNGVEANLSMNLTSLMAKASVTTSNSTEVTGSPAIGSSSEIEVYQIDNSTYMMDESGKWTHLKDPRPAEAIWANGSNNQVLNLAYGLNSSQIEVVGSEKIDGEDTYKLKIIPVAGDYSIRDNIALEEAGKAADILTRPPENIIPIPTVNGTELNETGKMEKLVWISQKTYLPVKYQSSMSFNMKPQIVGFIDLKGNQTVEFNQSVNLGEMSVNMVTADQYSGFNLPLLITPPEEALKAAPIFPSPIQAAPQASAA
jgi:outer membrane lipoprotein-sorting protein